MVMTAGCNTCYVLVKSSVKGWRLVVAALSEALLLVDTPTHEPPGALPRNSLIWRPR